MSKWPVEAVEVKNKINKKKMRKIKKQNRVIVPDPVYNDQTVTRFVNHLMYDGKKNTAFGIFYDSMNVVNGKLPEGETSPVEVWKKALENITPVVEVKSRRIGGATFQVPTAASLYVIADGILPKISPHLLVRASTLTVGIREHTAPLD